MPAVSKPTMGRGMATVAWRAAEGDYVRDLRLEKGMTQRELADAVGLDNNQTICQIERGSMHVPPERYAEFAQALGVDGKEFASALLRWTNPWMFALLVGCDPQLAMELRTVRARLNVPRRRPTRA